MTAQQLKASRTRLEAYLAEMLAPLGRKDRRHWGQVYVRGLLLDGERKSVGAMVAHLPEGDEQALQQFVSQSPWPWEPVWEKLAATVRSQKGEPSGSSMTPVSRRKASTRWGCSVSTAGHWANWRIVKSR